METSFGLGPIKARMRVEYKAFEPGRRLGFATFSARPIGFEGRFDYAWSACRHHRRRLSGAALAGRCSSARFVRGIESLVTSSRWASYLKGFSRPIAT